MQLTVLCLLGVAAGAYAQIGGGFGIVKTVNVSLLPLGSVEVSKGFGIGFDTNNRRRRDAPREPPKGPLLIARRPGGDRSKAGPGAEDLEGPKPNGQEPSRPKFGFGPWRHPSPPRRPLPPKRGHHGRKSTTTESLAESSSYSSSEASNESSSESSSEANEQASSEASNESSSQENNEASSESNSNESSESSNDSSNESDSNSSNESN